MGEPEEEVPEEENSDEEGPNDVDGIWPLEQTDSGWDHDRGEQFTYSRLNGRPDDLVVVASFRGPHDASFKVRLRFDRLETHRTREERWLMPVYDVNEGSPFGIFDMNLCPCLNGLVM